MSLIDETLALIDAFGSGAVDPMKLHQYACNLCRNRLLATPGDELIDGQAFEDAGEEIKPVSPASSGSLHFCEKCLQKIRLLAYTWLPKVEPGEVLTHLATKK